VTIVGAGFPDRFDHQVDVVDRQPDRVTLRVRPDQVGTVVAHLLETVAVEDLNIEDPPIEEVIEQVFAEAGAESE
jgi:ABC-2 type transport system ATP-binding protein